MAILAMISSTRESSADRLSGPSPIRLNPSRHQRTIKRDTDNLPVLSRWTHATTARSIES